MDNKFGGIIWTNHAIDRLRERGIKQGDAWATWRNPDQSRKGLSGNWVYYKTYGNLRIEVVATQNEKKEWIVLSVWSKNIDQNLKNFKTVNPLRKSFWREIVDKLLY